MASLLMFLLGVVSVVLAGLMVRRRWSFTAQRPDDYDQDFKQIDIRRILNGPIACEGMIYGPMGRVVSRFTGDFHAEWQGDNGRLEERFLFDTGNALTRVWNLTLGKNGEIIASADDLLGTGRGVQKGSAAHLKYRIRLTDNAGGHVLDVVDWMYLTPSGALMNRSQFRKFGFKVAEMIAVMRPVNEATQG